MAAKIDIEAINNFLKSRRNEAKNQQKIENSQSQIIIYRFKKKKRMYFDLLTFENL